MKKVAILGCENSHADAFLDIVINKKLYDDIDFVGVYSDDREAAEKLHEKYGVRVMEKADELVGELDGLIITARHGGKHHPYAKPYISSGIPMFIDKPITITEEDGIAFMHELKENGVRICGGSSCPHAKLVRELQAMRDSGEFGKVTGGIVRAPVSMENPHGGWFFYAQHLTEVMCDLFGYYPVSVQAFTNGNVYNFVVRYADYDVWVNFIEGNYVYAAGVSFDKKFIADEFTLDGCYESEFAHFHEILVGGESEKNYRDFIAPVFILNAMIESIRTGVEVKVRAVGE